MKELMQRVCNKTTAAADVASRLRDELERGEIVSKRECEMLARLLRESYATAVEIESQIHGNKPPKVGE